MERVSDAELREIIAPGRVSMNSEASLARDLLDCRAELAAAKRRIKQLEHGYDTLRTALHKAERTLSDTAALLERIRAWGLGYTLAGTGSPSELQNITAEASQILARREKEQT